jgi:hypothetical protein
VLTYRSPPHNSGGFVRLLKVIEKERASPIKKQQNEYTYVMLLDFDYDKNSSSNLTN